MRIGIGSDLRTHLTDFVAGELRKRGHTLEESGALSGEDTPWPLAAREVAEAVASGRCDQGILFCWTGTGVSLAANKVRGIRAALCHDAETAKGARKWNDANVLAMSLRSTSEQVAAEILEAWFGTPASTEPEDVDCVEDVRRMDADRD